MTMRLQLGAEVHSPRLLHAEPVLRRWLVDDLPARGARPQKDWRRAP